MVCLIVRWPSWRRRTASSYVGLERGSPTSWSQILSSMRCSGTSLAKTSPTNCTLWMTPPSVTRWVQFWCQTTVKHGLVAQTQEVLTHQLHTAQQHQCNAGAADDDDVGCGFVSQAVKKMDRQPSMCSQLSMMQMRNSMASTSDTDDVLNQILRGGSAGSSLRKSHYRPRLLLTTSVFRQQTSLCEILSSNANPNLQIITFVHTNASMCIFKAII